LLVWGSLAALFVGVLNSVRITLLPATLWQLAVYVVMIASGGGLMFRSLRGYADDTQMPATGLPPQDPRGDDADLRRELSELRRRLDNMDR
jgi:hypothetical protein